jgi:hypothetical protein
VLSFDAERHVYRYRGEVVPSVTQALAALYDFGRVPLDVLEHKRLIGECVHAAIDMDVRGISIDPRSIDESWAGYYEGWRRFMAQKRPEVLACEARVYHPTYRYAGTLDLRLRMDGALWWFDAKSTADVSPVVGLQTAAYQHAHCAERDEPIAGQRGALQLTPDGGYRIVEFTDPNDFSLFLAALNLHRFRQRHNL